LDELEDLKNKMAKIKLKKSHKSIILWEPKSFNDEFKPLLKKDYALSND
jgi:hypothetical protein